MEAQATETESSNSKAPAKVIRNAGIAASIWQRTNGKGETYFDFSISRSWKSDDGAGYSQNYFARNKDDLLKTIEEACVWIDSQSVEQ